jgi:hypothetical protein
MSSPNRLIGFAPQADRQAQCGAPTLNARSRERPRVRLRRAIDEVPESRETRLDAADLDDDGPKCTGKGR